MKRSRAPRLAFERLALSSVLALPRPVRARSGPSARAPSARAPSARAPSARALSGLALAAGALARALRTRRRLRISVLVALVALPLAFGAWRWVRSSSLVSVERVEVIGVHGPQAHEISRALAAAGKRMTTLNVDQRTLLAAVAQFHLVRALHVSTSFPHGLRIRVIEQLPVATLSVAGAKTAVAANGVVLGPALASSGLPTVSGAYLPPSGGLVHDWTLRAEVEVLGAVPRALAPFLSRAFEGPRGLTVAMRDGLQVYFGDSARPHAKWLALALVLSDGSSAHVSAVDVRTPERPAAQFPAGYAPATAAASGETGSSSAGGSSESIATALAAGLAASAGYSSSAEAHGANAAKAAEALSPSSSTGTSQSGSATGTSGAGSESSSRSEGESTGTSSTESNSKP